MFLQKSPFKIFPLLFVVMMFASSCSKEDKLIANFTAPVPAEVYHYEDEYDEGIASLESRPFDIEFSGVASPANIKLLDSAIKSGIVITPEIKGQFIWYGENILRFTPAEEWKPATEYKIKLSPEIFNSDLDKITRVYKFKTEDFSSDISYADMSANPSDMRTRIFAASITFNYEADPKSIETGVKVTVDGQPIAYTASFDEYNRTLNILSAPMEIIDVNRKLLFEASNITAKANGAKLKAPVRASAILASVDEFFKVANVSSEIVRNSKNDPEQALMVEFSAEVAPDIAASSIEVRLLPKMIPEDGEVVPDNLRERYGDEWTEEEAYSYLDKAKLIKAKRASMDESPSTGHAFIIDTGDVATRYAIVTVKPLESSAGFNMKAALQVFVQIPPYPQEVLFINEGSILPLTGEKILTFASRGAVYAKIDVGRVLDYQLQNIINATYSGGLNNAEFKGEFDETNFTSITSYRTFFPSDTPIKEANYGSIDLSKHLQSKDVGLFFVKVDTDYSDASRFILVTDMGIMRKINHDGSSSVFVMRISDGLPVPDAKVEILGKNGVPVHTGFTDEGGRFDYPYLERSYTNEKRPLAVVVRKGNDTSFLPLDKYNRKINFSNFDIGGMQESRKGMSAYLFTDRGLYRPSEEVKIAGIVKQADWRSLAGVALELRVLDPEENIKLLKRFTLSDEGLFDISFQTEAVSRTGIYNIELLLIDNDKNKNTIGSAYFNVNEFEPDSMRVKAKIITPNAIGWQKFKDIKGYAFAENLFGTPAVSRRVMWRAELAVSGFRFEELKDYKFIQPYINKTGRVQNRGIIKLEDTVTDNNGESYIDIPMQAAPGMYRLALAAEVFEPESGDSVYETASVRVSDADFLVGYKTASNLSFLNRDSDTAAEIIAIDNNLRPIAVDNLTISLYSKTYVASLTRSGSGMPYTYQTVERKSIINSGKFAIGKSGSSITFDTSNAGEYIVEISDNNARVLTSIGYFVSGESNITGGIQKNAELSLNLSSSEYKPGQEIELNIIAPYTGAGLITIERDKVYAYKWFKTDKTSSTQSIRIPDNLEGNAYVNVAFIRGISSKEIYMSPLSYAVAPFSIDKSDRRINIDISAPALSEPLDTVSINLKADNDAKVILFGVDEGILQVADYNAPNPLAYFFQKRSLQVSSYQTLDLILPDYSVVKEMFAAGGGESALAAGLNPFARRTLKPVVFWGGVVDLKKGMGYQYDYTIPHYFNGILKIMAVAVSSDRLGSASTSIVSRAPVILTPNAPLIAAPGDTFKISVGVSNNTTNSTAPANITVTAIPSDNLEITDEKSKQIEVNPSGERSVSFDVKVLDNIGSAEVSFNAALPGTDKLFKSSATLSVRPQTNYDNKITAGSYTSSSFTMKDIFRQMYSPYSKSIIGVSPDPLIVMQAVAAFLSDYQHGCTEQITSKTFPLLYLSADTEGAAISKSDADEAFKRVLDKLRTRQLSNGGFASWPGQGGTDKEVSAYAIHLLTDAKDLGFTVPDDIINKAKSSLIETASKEPANLEEARIQAYAIYLLARNGTVVTRYITRLDEYLSSNAEYLKKWKSDIGASYIGAAYILMKQQAEGAAMLKNYKAAVDKYIFYSDYDSSSTRNSAYLYLVAKHLPSHLPEIKGIADSIIKDITLGTYNTISSARAIMALGAYGEAGGLAQGEVGIKVFDKAGKELTLNMKTGKYTFAEFANNAMKAEITQSKPADTGSFYYLSQSGYDISTPAEMKNGIEIMRQYIDAAGNNVTSAKQGDELTVVVRIRANGERKYISNVVITDLLPGGFEVIRKAGSNNFNELYYTDIREDRVLMYTGLGDNILEIRYKVKMMVKGDFAVPPIYGESMYDKGIRGNSAAGRFKITGND